MPESRALLTLFSTGSSRTFHQVPQAC
uniref:Uncharacterized protein n=1 Tax=Anguilla anguilla TaxID=7936 RepID=A0A0E9UGU3_ANGAN